MQTKSESGSLLSKQNIRPHPGEESKSPNQISQGEISSPEKSPLKKMSIKDFTLIRTLGQGAYAEVVLAKKHSDGKRYAIKIMDKNYMKKEEKEYQVLAEKEILCKLNHPGIVKLFFAFHDKSKLYFVLEYLAGGTLSDFLESKGGKLELPLAKFLAAEMVLILEYLHKNEIVHRDIKPENIMLTKHGHLKAIDFATAKDFRNKKAVETNEIKSKELSETGSEKEELRHRSSFVGTAQFVSPELLEDSVCGAPADLWALGCIILLMTTGKMAFDGASEYLIFQQIKNVNIQWPLEMDLTARNLVERLLCKEPEARLGAGAEGSANDYAALKAHPYFDGIDFNKLFESDSPILKLRPSKKDKQTVKQLVLTKEPKLKYYDDILQKQMEIYIDNRIKAEVKSENEFQVSGPGHKTIFKSLDHPASTWVKAINQLSTRSNDGKHL